MFQNNLPGGSMSKFNSLTENKYTLRDIFVRNHEVWLTIPLFCYLLTPVIHMLVYTFEYQPSTQNEELIRHMLATGEWVGDYYRAIVITLTAFAAIFAVVALFSHFAFFFFV